MEMSFVAAMKHYFGFKDGQTPSGFVAELKNLTDADKAWFKANLATVGYTVVDSALAA